MQSINKLPRVSLNDPLLREGVWECWVKKKKKNPHRHRQQCSDYQKEWGMGKNVEESKGRINGDRRRLHFGC